MASVCADVTAVWPLAVYVAAVAALVVALLGMSYVLGERHRERTTGQAYESGMMPTGESRIKAPAGFYVVAILFVIFDLEAVLLVAWAVAARQAGWAGYAGAATIAGTLLVAWAYLWRVGALEWRKTGREEEKEEANAVQAPPLNEPGMRGGEK